MSSEQPERSTFFERQYLGAEDLNTLVDYGRDQRGRHMLGAHTWGIAAGLELRERKMRDDQVEIYIQPGYAWDGYGRPIIVLAPVRLSEGLFESFPYDERMEETDPKGIPVRVWIRYHETEYQDPLPGFEACDGQEQRARVRETFCVEVGDGPNEDGHGRVSVAGRWVDPEAALRIPETPDSVRTVLYDESVPFQAFPLDDKSAEWWIPLGLVRWMPRAGPDRPAYFPEMTEADHYIGRGMRRHIGVVAEWIRAPAGVVRVRDRVRRPRDPRLQDLLCVDGSLRTQGSVTLRAGKLRFLDHLGADHNVPLFIRRANDETGSPPTSGRDLRVVIGKTIRGENRLTVGPEVDGEFIPRLIVRDDGKVGVGTESPRHLLQVGDHSASSTVTLNVTGPDANSESSVLAFGTDFSIIHDTAAKRLKVASCDIGSILAFHRTTGSVGVGTDNPQANLHIKGDNPKLALDINSSSNHHAVQLQFSLDGTPQSRIYWSKADRRMHFVNMGRPAIMIDDAGRVGIGTPAPSDSLEVQGNIRFGQDGELYALGALRNLRLVTGRLNKDGVPLFCLGDFEARKLGETGEYEITFPEPFSSPPVVVVSAGDPAARDDNVANAFQISAGGFKVWTTDSGQSVNTAEDSEFNFIALGPR